MTWLGARCPATYRPGTPYVTKLNAGCGRSASRGWSTTCGPCCAWLPAGPKSPPPWCSTAGRYVPHPRLARVLPEMDTNASVAGKRTPRSIRSANCCRYTSRPPTLWRRSATAWISPTSMKATYLPVSMEISYGTTSGERTN